LSIGFEFSQNLPVVHGEINIPHAAVPQTNHIAL
jgi:hypothetical protein